MYEADNRNDAVGKNIHFKYIGDSVENHTKLVGHVTKFMQKFQQSSYVAS